MSWVDSGDELGGEKPKCSWAIVIVGVGQRFGWVIGDLSPGFEPKVGGLVGAELGRVGREGQAGLKDCDGGRG